MKLADRKELSEIGLMAKGIQNAIGFPCFTREHVNLDSSKRSRPKSLSPLLVYEQASPFEVGDITGLV